MSAPAMDSGWYYSLKSGPPGQQTGPLSWEDLVANARGGAFGPDDYVWHEQLGDWLPGSKVPGLFAARPAAPAGYAAPAAYGAAQPAGSKLLYWLLPLIAIIIVGGGLGAYFGFFYHNGNAEAFVQNQGEILLEPSGVAGPDSFAGEQFVVLGPSTTLKIPNPQVTLPRLSTTLPLVTTTAGVTTSAGAVTTEVASTTTATTAMPTTVLAAYPGDTPALYGGSKSKVISDKEQELAFLEQNPQKAAAFCEALNSDPTLRWTGGNKVTPDQLRAYFAELTPVMLTRDIRVTNYGYKNGHPTPRQSVLQAGQLVLIDQYGVPRKRCECGNPLTPPIPSSRPPVYTGPQWPGFDPTTVIVVQQTTVIINNFTLINVNTGDTYGRPAGTEGGSDGAPPTGGETTETTETTSTTEATTTSSTEAETTTTMESGTTTTTGGGAPVTADELNGLWSGTFTISTLNLDPAVQQQAEAAGCTAEILGALVGKPMPMTMEITMEAGGAGGIAKMTIDASALGGSSTTNEPQTFSFNLDGDTLTFTVPQESGATSTMTGKVSRQGQNLVITGAMTSSGEGSELKADWSATKQVVM
jgi:hypothetical protein